MKCAFQINQQWFLVSACPMRYLGYTNIKHVLVVCSSESEPEWQLAQRPRETHLEAILAKLNQLPLCLTSNSNFQLFYQGQLAKIFYVLFVKGWFLQIMVTLLVNCCWETGFREEATCPGVSPPYLSLSPYDDTSHFILSFPGSWWRIAEDMLQRWWILQAVFVLILVYIIILITEFSMFLLN